MCIVLLQDLNSAVGLNVAKAKSESVGTREITDLIDKDIPEVSLCDCIHIEIPTPQHWLPFLTGVCTYQEILTWDAQERSRSEIISYRYSPGQRTQNKVRKPNQWTLVRCHSMKAHIFSHICLYPVLSLSSHIFAVMKK